MPLQLIGTNSLNIPPASNFGTTLHAVTDQVEKMAHARNGVHSKLREKAYNLCRDYLQGSWSKISLDEFGINVLGCVLFFLSRTRKTREDSLGFKFIFVMCSWFHNCWFATCRFA